MQGERRLCEFGHRPGNTARRDAVAGMEELGIVLDERRNLGADKGARRISADDSPIAVLVIPTNEELAIARDCVNVLTS